MSQSCIVADNSSFFTRNLNFSSKSIFKKLVACKQAAAIVFYSHLKVSKNDSIFCPRVDHNLRKFAAFKILECKR